MKTCRLFLILSTVVILGGCATPGLLTGTVSTAFYAEPEGPKRFVVVLPDSLSLRDRKIGELVERRLVEHGYVKASNKEEANTSVLVRYSVGQGALNVISSPDFVWGGQKVETSTTYPRFFQVIVIDLRKSRLPEEVEVIWQGEVYSKGSSSDMMGLAEHFINTLFDNYGKTITHKRFGKVVML